MATNTKIWRTLFLFCAGLAIGTSFCMKWMEPDLQTKSGSFGIVGLELFYSKEKLAEVLSGLDEKVSGILSYHLYFDFAFMAGIFPAITSLCMMARERTHIPRMKKLLFVLAILQPVAWGLDIFENTQLLSWLKNPIIGDNDLFIFHIAVATKWVIALSGFVLSIPFFFIKRKTMNTG